MLGRLRSRTQDAVPGRRIVSILTRKVLRRSEFVSRSDFVSKMLAFIEHRNTTATPFKWAYDAQRAP